VPLIEEQKPDLKYTEIDKKVKNKEKSNNSSIRIY
jgi:hypothetical protein